MPPPPWGADMDFNLVQRDGATNSPATRLQQQSGRDEHSIVADAQFIDPAHGDYRVKAGSPALALGFVNFPMDQFGVQKPELKAIARKPAFPGQKPTRRRPPRSIRPRANGWRPRVRNITSEGEMSALGLPGVTGALVLEVPVSSVLARNGLQKGDVILSINGTAVNDVDVLMQAAPALIQFQTLTLGISRQQKQRVLSVTP